MYTIVFHDINKTRTKFGKFVATYFVSINCNGFDFEINPDCGSLFGIKSVVCESTKKRENSIPNLVVYNVKAM